MEIRHKSYWVVGERTRPQPTRLDLRAGEPVLVGRDPGCDLRLSGRWVSKRHASFLLEDGRVLVRDLGSRNGTFVCNELGTEGERIEGVVELAGEQAVRIAECLFIPCRALADTVGVDEMPQLWPEDAAPTTIETGPDLPLESTHLAQQALAESWRGEEGADAWRRVLLAITRLVPADDGFLLSREGDRFLLRAHLDDQRPYLLSRGFLLDVIARGRVTGAVLADESVPPATESLAGYRPGTCLVGVPIRCPGEDAMAVACLETRERPHSRLLHALDRLAVLVAPLLEQAVDLDRERRRREAAERQIGDLRGESAPSGAGVASSEVAIVGQSPALRAAVRAARQAAASSASVLLRGPSGSGKELLARLVHDASPRAAHPFVAVNCAAIPDELVESELFGHDRGAFTGADRQRDGAFQRAHGGTFFLDEVGDLSAAAQAKVLRALDTGEVVRVGGSVTRVDVRLVAATHRDLEAMVKAGEFRQDLYYRLRVVEIILPPLAQRAEDIIPLAEHFLASFRRPDGARVTALSTGAARALARYAWPGNIRELRNVVERAVVLDRDGVIARDDLPLDLQQSEPGDPTPLPGEAQALTQLPWKEARSWFSRIYFRQALARHGGRVGETAQEAGISRRALTEIIRRHELR